MKSHVRQRDSVTKVVVYQLNWEFFKLCQKREAGRAPSIYQAKTRKAKKHNDFHETRINEKR